MMIGENYPLNASGAAKVTTSFLLVINPPERNDLGANNFMILHIPDIFSHI
ncbi:hypothetical protein N5T04_27380 [Escherichia coli]|uniref:hypothetical protein n=1 Tax=Escherichia coli TaxID=562 RepID=UPI002228014D|nr:hypothetical protein [Escherichia coli]MCW3377948.1 hypothetical protein [Escherichia coli]